MKTMPSRLQFLAIAGLLLLPPTKLTAEPVNLNATEPVKFDDTLSIDAHGNGTLEIKTHLHAMQWRRWEVLTGNSPDLMLRDLKRRFASYDLDTDSFRLD